MKHLHCCIADSPKGTQFNFQKMKPPSSSSCCCSLCLGPNMTATSGIRAVLTHSTRQNARCFNKLTNYAQKGYRRITLKKEKLFLPGKSSKAVQIKITMIFHLC
uniref:Uncharacterized protein n=1 Tax=Arundo donax TaxID=35708 RepID=A0A0A9DKJ0_ARUDO